MTGRLDVTVVGCSGSLPGPDGAASSYLVRADDDAGRTWSLLLDLGNGALGRLQTLLDLGDLDAVVLSHLHPDHCLDLCGLYVHDRYRPGFTRPGPLPVHGPRGVGARIVRAYDGEADAVEATFAFHELSAGTPVRVGPMTVTPFPARHPVPAFCLRVQASGAVLAYSGDTDTCDGLVECLRGADLALLDTAFVDGRDEPRGIHLTGSRGAQACLDAGGVGHVVLTHLAPWNDPQVCLEQARSVWSGPLDVAAPGATFVVASGRDVGGSGGVTAPR